MWKKWRHQQNFPFRFRLTTFRRISWENCSPPWTKVKSVWIAKRLMPTILLWVLTESGKGLHNDNQSYGSEYVLPVISVKYAFYNNKKKDFLAHAWIWSFLHILIRYWSNSGPLTLLMPRRSHETCVAWSTFSIPVAEISVVDPNRLCSDPDPGSHVHSDPAPDPNRIGINSDPDPT